METESGIVAPSFSQGQEATFEGEDFGLENYPDDEFPMDDSYDDPMTTENHGSGIIPGDSNTQFLKQPGQDTVLEKSMAETSDLVAQRNTDIHKGDGDNADSDSRMDDYPVGENYDESLDQDDVNFTDQSFEDHGYDDDNIMNQAYEEGANESFAGAPSQEAKKNPDKDNKGNPNQSAENYPSKGYDEYSSQSYEANSKQNFGDDPSQGYPNQNYEGGANQHYQGDPNQGYRGDPNQGYGSVPNQGFQGDPSQDYEGATNQVYGGDPNKVFEGDPHQGYENPNEDYKDAPNQGYRGDPNQGYGDFANQGYTDYPNQGYEGDPSQSYDPNQDFDGNANAAYEGDLGYEKQGAAGPTEGEEGYFPPEGGYYDQYNPEQATEEQDDEEFEGEDEDYEEEEDGESEGEESEDESEDEAVAEAINSVNFDTDFGTEESSDRMDAPGSEFQPPADNVPGTSEQTAEDSSEKPEKKKRKRKKKGEAGDTGNKPKRKRKKKGETDEDGEKKKADKSARKNIRKILSENKLEQETLDAQAAELERQRRIQELKKQQLASLLHISPEKEVKKEKDSQLKSLLQTAEEEAEKETDENEEKPEKREEKKEPRAKKEGIIDISSGEEDEDVVMVNSEEEEEEDMSDEDYAEAEDVNNSGSHINDMYNVRDEKGRVLVNVGHPTADPDIYLSPLVARHIKPHQIGGVRFLYDNLVECVNRFKTSAGFGCILAHSMGLGKTIQVIGFIDIFLRHTGARNVIVIVPINTLANWMAEFNMWVPDKETCEKYNIPPGESDPRPYTVYMLNDLVKNTPARAKVVDTWYQTGGVLLLGYEMYRLLSSKKVHLQKTTKGRKKATGSNVIDVEEEDRDKKLLMNIHEALVNPGPDLVVCDEGHRIKNSHAGISQSLKQIKTKRRIVLTGYPLQNNLVEYWCMVDFVRPNFLGTKTEFCNMFERPIMNGQCVDSTPQDVRLMRYRAHVLHSLLEGFVQRRGHTVLQAALPPKEEYVFMIRMSHIQQKLYEKFMESVIDQTSNGWMNNNPLKAFSVCCKIWNHPDILYTCMKKSLDDNDLDIETGEPKKKGGRGRSKKETPPATPNPEGGASPIAVPVPGLPGQGPTLNVGRQNEPSITYDWANEILKDYVPGMLDNGGKMVILFNLIEQSLLAGDKILVFSQSLFTLNLIEELLGKRKVPRPELDEYWCRNRNYFRLDGSTSSSDRERLINQFNAEANKWVFLLSTRAGSLGINLVGANRVIVIDASWNPCHDCQAICRVYRFGQVKPSYIYRLVTENTMERKIYDRQINKQGMSDRVVDELNPQNQFRREHVDKLLYHENREFPEVDFSECQNECNDSCMVTVLKHQGHWLTAKPFTHESLLIDRKELKLTMKEKRLAKQSYVMEKRLNVSYSRPSYAAYYPRGAAPYQGAIRGRGGAIQRPIASVKPMVSTPVPMRPKIVAAPQILKPGVSVHQVLTTTEIVLPGTNTSTEAGTTEPKKIPAGQQVLVIRTPKGVYIRTPDGKIFAVRSKPQPDSTSPLDTLANTGSNMTTGGVTIVRPTTTTTVSSGSATSKLPAGVTVIRPKPGPITSTKPLTIIRQGPGQIKTIIPVTIGAKLSTGSTTPGQIATISAQSQKLSTTLPGAKIKIVAPNTNTINSTTVKVSSLAALKNLSEGKKTVANSLAFSGGNTIVKKVAPKQQPVIDNIKTIMPPSVTGDEVKVDTSTEQSEEDKMDVTPDVTTDGGAIRNMAMNVNKSKDASWNLPPIDMKALKLPQQFSGVQNKGKKKLESSQKKKPVSKTLKQEVDINQAAIQKTNKKSKPKFTLSESPSDSNQSGSLSPELEAMNAGVMKPPVMSQLDHLSTRPSDIDLHEMKLTSNPNSMSDFSQIKGNPNPTFENQPASFSSNYINNQSGSQPNMGYHQSLQPTQTKGSRSNSGIFNPGLPNTSTGNETKNTPRSMGQGQTPVPMGQNQTPGLIGQSQIPGPMGQNQMPLPKGPNQTSFQEQMFANNQGSSGMFGDSAGGGFMNMQTGNKNLAPGFGNQNLQNTSLGFGNQNAGLGNQTSIFGNQNSSFGSQNTNFGNQNSSLGNQNPGLGNQNPGLGNQNPSLGNQNASFGSHNPKSGTATTQQGSDSMADFTMSGIHNNSSFLSELTDADDNFLSQIDAYSDQSSQSSIDTAQTMNQTTRTPQNTGMGQQAMGSQSGNMGMHGYSQGANAMNYDMFSNQQQQNQNFFPTFAGNNQFNRSSNFGNQQNMPISQGVFPGGSMYPMSGMMQPGMFPYPAFPAYPYAPMMHPMPYYPMPFQPQYGGQAGNLMQQSENMVQQGSNMAQPGSNMGQQGTSMGQLGSTIGQQGSNSGQLGSNMGQASNMGQLGSNMGMTVGQQGDNSFQPGIGGQ